MSTRAAIATLAAVLLASVSVGVSATPAEAGWVDGWYTFYGKATKTQTFRDRSPLKTRFVLKLQRKRGAKEPCEARVLVDKGPWSGRSARFSKPSRGAWEWHAGSWDWRGDETRRVKVKVKTNGDCIYRVWLR